MRYYNPKLNKEDLKNRIIQLDKELNLLLFMQGIKSELIFKLIIAGSSSLIFQDINISATVDIDAFVTMNSILTEDLLNKYDINTKISTYENSLPYNYQDRIKPLDMNTKIIKCYVLSVEDAVIAKIGANRKKDIDHLMASNLLANIHWDLLHTCALEMEMSSLNQHSYREFVSLYNKFVKENHHEEVIIENI